MGFNNTISSWDDAVAKCRSTMVAKNSAYGDSWRALRQSSITDLVLAKVNRIINIEDSSASQEESILDNWMDIVNYAVFSIIRILEDNAEHGL